jgi:drug/metabolite transporter (DMT)-like permease
LPSSRANRRGIIALVVGMAGYTVNDTFVKFVAQSYPVGEVIFIRGILTNLLLGAIIVWAGLLPEMTRATDRRVTARAIADGLASGLYIIALSRMPMADIAAVLLLAPLLLTAMAVFFYGEIVGWRRWTAVMIGFTGTLFVVKPTPATFDAWAVVALMAAFASAGRDLLTRRIDPSIPTLILTFMGSIAVTIAGLMLAGAEDWRMPALRDIALLGMAAAFLAFGAYFVALAFRGVDVSVVAPFRYTLLLWAGIAGFLTFGEIPDGWAALGAALIAGSGLYVLHRDAVRRRKSREVIQSFN